MVSKVHQQDLFQASHSFIDNKIIEGVNYQGLPLLNYAGTHGYSRVTLEECQYLCEITDLCRYFDYVVNSSPEYKNVCYLQFGVGYRIANDGGAFGHKFSLGEPCPQYPNP